MTEEPERYRFAFTKVLNLSLLLTLPGNAWASATVEVLIPFVLGDSWQASEGIFAALGFAGMV
jgi:PST family polysaccharide transporter